MKGYLKRINVFTLMVMITAVNACGGGGSSDKSPRPLESDTSPDSFSFAPQTEVEVGRLVTSNVIKIVGIDTAAPVSVMGGEYSIDGGGFTSSDGTVEPGQNIRVRTTAANNYGESIEVVLTVGGVNAVFTVTTITMNLAPTANAGNDQMVHAEEIVKLTGIGSDNDGTIASYRWTQVSGHSVSLSGTSTPSARFVMPPGVHTLTFRLTVTDNRGESSTDNVRVHTKPAVSDLVVFEAYSDKSGTEPWVTGGLEANTRPLIEINDVGHNYGARQFGDLDGTLYFNADDGIHGNELWKYENGKAELVKDFRLTDYADSFRNSSDIEYIFIMGGYLFIQNNDPVENAGLWRLDRLNNDLRRIFPSVANKHIVFENHVFFEIQSRSGNSLWRSDGNSEGTVKLFDMKVESMIVAGDRLFIVEEVDGSNRALHVSDGTKKGTVLLRRLSGGGDSFYLTEFKSDLFFVAHDTSSGWGVWRSDGTMEGTKNVMDIGQAYVTQYINPSFATNGALLFFKAYTDANHIYATDGTPSRIWSVMDFSAKDIDIGSPFVYQDLFSAGEYVFFEVRVDGNKELWRTDGSGEGTIKLAGVSIEGLTSAMVEHQGNAYFVGDDGTGLKLWMTDGSVAGTSVVKDFSSAVDIPDIAFHSASIDETFYFAVDDGIHGNEIWTSDGTPSGTRLLADINQTTNASSRLVSSVNLGDKVVFSAVDHTGDSKLWASDGTIEGTNQVVDFNRNGKDSVYNIASAGEFAFLFAEDEFLGRELWRTDGTPTGTELVKDLSPGEQSTSMRTMQYLNGALYLIATDMDARKDAIWVSDGTDEGTQRLHQFDGRTERFRGVAMTSVNDKVFMAINDPDSGLGAELWVSDGSPDGTFMVKDLYPGGNGLDERYGGIASFDGAAFFIGRTDHASAGLWRSDGSETGTKMVVSFDAESGGNRFNGAIAAIPSGLIFTVFSDEAGQELWVSDGTEEGSRMIKELIPGNKRSLAIRQFHVVQDVALFTLYSRPTGRTELWRTDGTDSGTIRVFSAESENIDIEVYEKHNGLLYFYATDEELDIYQVWCTDGTPENTRMIYEFDPGLTVVPEL
ncbi:PKD domain-containing protein [Gilvimarinus sp. F26214L]|uniref:PKD domain-containing protein n=1 Tax=Gilvimarinus sp. DZF01 TaxID=3461371 RepID=UPI0040468106